MTGRPAVPSMTRQAPPVSRSAALAGSARWPSRVVTTVSSPSSTDTAFSLTTTNAAATLYTLTIMTWVAVIFTPIVLGYQAWTYWIFRKRISVHHIPTPVLAGSTADAP